MATATNTSNGDQKNVSNRSRFLEFSPVQTVPLILDNKDVVTAETFAVTSPADNREKVLWKCSAASTDDARRAVESAAAAFPAWSKTKPQVRRDILLKAANVMEAHHAELDRAIVLETAAKEGWGGFNIAAAIEFIREVAGRITSVSEGRIPISLQEGKTALVYQEPYGVVFAIAPWNAPVILGVRALLYPLAVGNTVILKASELSPLTYHIIADIFRQAGLPAGCLNTIIHSSKDGAKIAQEIISNPAVRMVNFTGSTTVGHQIATVAGKYGKPVLLELGGKAPVVVFKDADITEAAEGAAWGISVHSGQVCMSTERIIVEESIREEFLVALKASLAKTWSHPHYLVLPTGADKIDGLISDAVSKGAKLAHGSVRHSEESWRLGGPLVVTGVTREMDIYDSETFGPVVTLATFENEEQAVELANDTAHGLTAAVWTRDLQKGLRVAKQIHSGAVHINSATIHDEPTLPHGGFKNSGFGRFGGSWGLEAFLSTKTITFKV